ncbi:MAG: FmdB family zinc ribbon protein [Candidatus Hydrogenedentota bacterium]
MPTYTYQCKKCGETEDHFHGMNAKPRVKCQACGGACKRLIGSGAGIIFKGSGFYETDYKTKSGKPSDVGSENGSKSSDSKSSDSKKSSESKSSSDTSSKSSTKKETSKTTK